MRVGGVRVELERDGQPDQRSDEAEQQVLPEHPPHRPRLRDAARALVRAVRTQMHVWMGTGV